MAVEDFTELEYTMEYHQDRIVKLEKWRKKVENKLISLEKRVRKLEKRYNLR